MSDLFSSLLIFTIIKTILSTFFFTVSKFYKNLVKWVLTEIEWSVAGTTTLDREWQYTNKKQSNSANEYAWIDKWKPLSFLPFWNPVNGSNFDGFV